MRRERIVPYGGLAFVVIASLLLMMIVLRSPDTHGHFWRVLPRDYNRTPVGDIGEADLRAILADLPPFAFPPPSKAAASAPAAGHDMAGMESSTSAQSGQAEPQMAGMDSSGSAQRDADVQKITLTESEYAISPDRLALKVGVPVELTVTNTGKQAHGLWIPEFGIAEDIRSGKTKVFRFTPDKPGRIRYVCSYSLCGTEAEHARMVGFLTVR